VSNEIRVVITGVAGKMGKETAKAVLNEAPGPPGESTPPILYPSQDTGNPDQGKQQLF
jgi:hypothetical protein